MAGKARTLTLKTKVEVTGADKLNNLGQKMQTVGRNLTVGVTLPVLGLGGALVAMSEEAARADAELSRTFESMGAGAWTTVDALKATQQELQGLTTFGDEEISHLQSVLLTFGNVTGEAFDRGTKAALDMSAMLGTDLQSSAIQVGKALNDPIKGVTALTRVGVSFTQAQKDQIKTLTESGDLMGAQTIILGELEKQFGGAAEAMAGTASGQFKQALNALGDAGEEFGAIIAPVLTDAANLLKGVATWLKELDPDTKTWIVRIAALAAALGPVVLIVGTLISTFSKIKGAAGTVISLAPKIGAAFTLMTGPIGVLIAAVGLLAVAFATDFLGIRTRLEEDLKDAGNTINNFALDFGDMGDTVHRMAEETGTSFQDMKDKIKAEMEESGDNFEQVVRRIEHGGTALTDAQRDAAVESGRAWQSYNDQLSAAMYGTDGAVPTIGAATDDMAEEMGGAPEKMADAMLANQFELGDAIDQMITFMDTALSPAQEVFNARAFLASQEYRDGMNSGIPSVREKAQELGEEATATLEKYSDGYGAGAKFSNSFAYGMKDAAALDFVERAAATVGKHARDYFPGSEPKKGPLQGITKGFGFSEIFAKGVLSGQAALDRAFGTLLGGGLTVPSLALASAGGGSVPAAGAGGTVINNFYLQWDGEPPKGRNEAEIITNLQRLVRFTDSGIGG